MLFASYRKKNNDGEDTEEMKAVGIFDREKCVRELEGVFWWRVAFVERKEVIVELV